MRSILPQRSPALVTLPLLLYLTVAPQLQLAADLFETERHPADPCRKKVSRMELQSDPGHECHNCLTSHPPIFISSAMPLGLAVELPFERDASSGQPVHFSVSRLWNLHLRSPPA